jgi:hypothetical protein
MGTPATACSNGPAMVATGISLKTSNSTSNHVNKTRQAEQKGDMEKSAQQA